MPTAEDIYADAAAAGSEPDPLLTVSEWADQYRHLSQRSSSEPGPWRTDRTPYLKKIMDSLSSSSRAAGGDRPPDQVRQDRGRVARRHRAHRRRRLGARRRAQARHLDVDAFKRTLLNAKSIAHSKEGASGVYFMGLLDRLGIAAEIKPKLIGSPPGAGGLVSPVVKGEAEIVVGTTSAIMEPGVELVGPIPNELQNWAVFTGGVSTASKDAAAAQALIAFMTAPGAVAVIKAKGMEPLGK